MMAFALGPGRAVFTCGTVVGDVIVLISFSSACRPGCLRAARRDRPVVAGCRRQPRSRAAGGRPGAPRSGARSPPPASEDSRPRPAGGSPRPSTRSNSSIACRTAFASAAEISRASIAAFTSRTRSKTAASAAAVFRSCSSADLNALRAFSTTSATFEGPPSPSTASSRARKSTIRRIASSA